MNAQVEPATTKRVVRSVVPMIHVADVRRSAAFYKLLGFEVGNSVPLVEPAGDCTDEYQWAWLYSPGAQSWKAGPNLMLARTSRPLNPGAQDVLFYLYAIDLVAMRNELLARGVEVSEIQYPEYLPKGEFRISDLDGYCLMIAQSSEDTP